jgi:hypothetical protein
MVSIYTCAFDGTDSRLVGELREKSLHGVPMFENCFTGLERATPIIIPEQGELRFTYFLKSPSELRARVRVAREGGTIPCDVSVPAPVVGTPTEVRIPFSDFKPAYGGPGPNLAPGEQTTMIYIFSIKPDSGLRLDALSLIEIRK